MKTVSLTRRMDFSASHRVWRADWDSERNLEIFGPRSGSAAHGHNYRLEVTLRGEVDPDTGMLIDLKYLKDVMDREIGERFDHRNLNEDTPFFRDRAPTAENLVGIIFELLDAALPAGLLHRVCLSPIRDLQVEASR